MTEQTAPESATTLVHTDPNDLIFTANVRLDARLDAEFVASITERGVIEPVVATRREDGALVIFAGHRRTLAAVQAGRESIPVYVIAATADADRVIDQLAENDHRAALTVGERIAAFAQLDALGLSAAEIAKQTASKPADIKAALTTSASKAATDAANRYAALTLEQSAVLAEFEDEPGTIERLIAALAQGMFDHVAQRARDERAQRLACEVVEQSLRDAGVVVIEAPDYNATARRVERLVDSEGQRLTITGHATCPGHAAFVRWEGYWIQADPDPENEEEATADPDEEVEDEYDDDEDQDDDTDDDEDDEPSSVPRQVYVRAPVTDYACTDPTTYGHRDAYASAAPSSGRTPAADLSEEERETKAAERRDVIASNKAWDSAQTVRRAWLAGFAGRKTPPKGAMHFITATIAANPHLIARTGERRHALGCDLLGVKTTKTYQAPVLVTDKTPAPRAQVIALVLVLAAHEEATGRHSWRNVSTDTARYLRFIEAQGYGLSDVERRACGEDPIPDEASAALEAAESAEEVTQAA